MAAAPGPRVLARAPDHLGDGVMALPALARLAAVRRLVIAAPGWGPVLYRHLDAEVIDRDGTPDAARDADVAVLLKPSFSAAWQARGARRRVGEPTDHRRFLLTDPVRSDASHRADRLLAVACAALDEWVPGPALPAFPTDATDGADLPPLPADAVLLLPGTASAATVAWRRMEALAAALGARAVVAGGPGDEEAVAGVAAAAGVAPLPVLPLPALARLAVEVTAVVGNDSGLPHLCAAARRGAGRDPADVHVVTASTDPARTVAPGATSWAGPRPPCWPCYAKTCGRGDPVCRDADPAPLVAALGGRLGGAP